MSQHKIHDQHDAITMSLSAIAMMTNTLVGCWKSRCERAAASIAAGDKGDADYLAERIKQNETDMTHVTAHLDSAMQTLGYALNGMDACDEHDMTLPAFEAMRRAMENPTTEASK